MTVVLRYQKVKNYIFAGLEAGRWKTGDKIPSETELVKALGASRMTVNRAVRELADLGLLERIPGAGTFVARSRKAAQLLEVKDIADQIRENGQRYGAEVIILTTVATTPELTTEFEDAALTELFHSVIVHKADDVPVQLETRFVNPASDPDYLDVDFTRTTPTERLIAVAPLAEVEHVVEAVMPTAADRALLHIDETTPCLLLTRRTWSADRVASFAQLQYPGQRFRLGTRFSYRDRQSERRGFQ
jgi:GntR family histidine utilization transcriptional repressor